MHIAIGRELELINCYPVLVAAFQVVKPEALFLYRDGCAMTMPQGPSGTLHDLVALYAKMGKTMPQLVAMHYAVQVRVRCYIQNIMQTMVALTVEGG